MSKLNLVRRCYNCGAILQGDDSKQDGYIDPEVLGKSNALVLFCDHCYQQQKYNFSSHELTCSKDYMTMMADAAATDALIVFVVDLFSFESSFVSGIFKKIKNNPILVIGNKRDLLPKTCNDEELCEYVAHRFRVSGCQVGKDDVILASINSLAPNDTIYKAIEKKRQRHDVYIVGAAGAGKTMLLSSILRGYKNKTAHSVVTAPYPGTSLQVMQIPLDSSSCIYDTPGTSVENSIAGKASADVARKCYPIETVKPRSFSLIPGDCLFLGGLARIELRKGKRTEVTFFGAKTVKALRVRNKNPEALFFRMIDREELEPSFGQFNNQNAFDVFDLEIDETGSRDIGIMGLGWIRFQGDVQTFRVFLPKGVSLYTSRSKVLPESRK